jgi:hypothetical protein
MMEVLGIIIGIGVIAIAPTVPVLRDAAKTVAKGGIVIAEKSKEVLSVTSEHWADLIAEAQAEREAAQDRAAAAEAVDVTVSES